MSIFDSVNYLLFDKAKDVSTDALDSFVPYMVSRYMTFYGDGIYANYVNDTLNRYGSIFTNNEEQFDFYNNIIPKLKRKKIEYVKKTKEVKEDEQSIPEFYCKREWALLQNMIE